MHTYIHTYIHIHTSPNVNDSQRAAIGVDCLQLLLEAAFDCVFCVFVGASVCAREFVVCRLRECASLWASVFVGASLCARVRGFWLKGCVFWAKQKTKKKMRLVEQ